MAQQLKLKEGNLYRITWRDHSANSTWQFLEDVKKTSAWLGTTVGWYGGTTPDGQIILYSTSTDVADRVSEVMKILKECVVKVVHLKGQEIGY